MNAKHIVLVILTLVIGLGALAAQEAQAAEVKTDPVNLATIFRDSNQQGFFGYLILLVFIVGIVYAVIRYIQLFHK